MNENNSKNGASWPQDEPRLLEELHACIKRAFESGGGVRKIAWRGHAKLNWCLEPTLDRDLSGLEPEGPYKTRLERERVILEQFRNAALAYASESEKPHLQSVWGAMAVARHAGLATRLLDWTFSPWVALWFASHDQSHQNDGGVLWWFDIRKFNDVVHIRWNQYGVETRANALGLEGHDDLVRLFHLDERFLEPTAFSQEGKPWICQLHYPFPCSRMAAQQGFATVCGQLGLPHEQAIDALGDLDAVPRGKILVPANLKAEALAYLSSVNIHAASLEYPALDECARQIMNDFRAGKLAPSKRNSRATTVLKLSTDTSTNHPETH